MTSPYFTTQEAADYYRFPSLGSVREFITRYNTGRDEADVIKTFSRGRAILIDKASFDRALIRREPQR